MNSVWYFIGFVGLEGCVWGVCHWVNGPKLSYQAQCLFLYYVQFFIRTPSIDFFLIPNLTTKNQIKIKNLHKKKVKKWWLQWCQIKFHVHQNLLGKKPLKLHIKRAIENIFWILIVYVYDNIEMLINYSLRYIFMLLPCCVVWIMGCNLSIWFKAKSIYIYDIWISISNPTPFAGNGH